MRAARLCAALAVSAVLAVPAVAHADPPVPASVHADPPVPASVHADASVPAGWVAGGAASIMAPATPPAPRSRLALQLGSSPPRIALTPVPVMLADVDTVEIAPSPTAQEIAASNADPPGDPPEELFIDRGCTRASVSGHAVGSIEVGWLDQPIAPRAGGGVMLYGVRGEHGGGDGRHRYVRASWETLDRLPDGTLRFTETVARFNVVTCKAYQANRYSAIARPILGGRAFLFRTRCPACDPRFRDELHAITANGGFGVDDYQHHVTVLAPGRAGGFATHLDLFHATTFARAAGQPAPALRAGTSTLVGLEAAQGLGESAPTVIAYTADVPERP